MQERLVSLLCGRLSPILGMFRYELSREPFMPLRGTTFDESNVPFHRPSWEFRSRNLPIDWGRESLILVGAIHAPVEDQRP